MNKIKLFLYNVKNSWFFLLVIFVELALCMTLLSVALTNFLGENDRFAYYNKNVADKSFVTFDGYDLDNDTTVKSISKYLSDDLSALATSVDIGHIKGEYPSEQFTPLVTVATPALCANFNSKGLRFSNEFSSEYREAYVNKSFAETYRVGEIYDISVDDHGGTYDRKVKILGYLNGKDYYVFSSGDIYFRTLQMLVRDELPQFASLSSGIFINDKGVDFYRNLGFKALTVQQYYDYEKEDSPFMNYLYLAIVIMLFTFVTILCNYVLSVDKMSKRSATLFVCGNTNAASVAIEVIKMLAVFLTAFIVGICISSIMVYVGMENQNVTVTMPNFYLSALIIFGLYVLAVVIGFVKFVRAKPLKIIENTKN